jgi:uncharacterized protein
VTHSRIVKPPRRLILLTIAFEAALGVVGWALAAWTNVPVAPRLQLSPTVASRSALALIPMMLLLVLGMRSQWPPIARFRHEVQTLVQQMFGWARWWELLTISLAAGVGEELLFRGALQPLASRWLGPAGGLLLASVAFGALHAVSVTYLLSATAVGIYFGWLAQHYDDLVAPIIVHALYDWAALLVLRNAPTESRELSG